MFNHAPRFWSFIAVAILLTLAACSKKDASPLTDASGPLRYVPADTPYIFGALEPAPDDFMDKMEPKIDQLLAAQRRPEKSRTRNSTHEPLRLSKSC